MAGRVQFLIAAAGIVALLLFWRLVVTIIDRVRSDAPGRTFSEGEDWAVCVETELDQATKVLTRRITSLRRVETCTGVTPKHTNSSSSTLQRFYTHWVLSGFKDKPWPTMTSTRSHPG